MSRGASLDEVARRAGVSAATVSRALSGRGHVAPETRERVRDAAAALGYVASWSASALASGRTRTVAVVSSPLHRWSTVEAVAGAEEVLARHGYGMTLSVEDGSGRRPLDPVRRGAADAVLLVGPDLRADAVRRAPRRPVPVVAVDGRVEGIRTVGADATEAARLVTEHLRRLGHSRIERVADPGAAVGGLVAARVAARRLLERSPHRPTALVAASDELAVALVLAARELGLDVPRDVAVAGVDGSPLAEAFGVTTVARHPRQQGRLAAQLLLDGLDGALRGPRMPPPSVAMELVVRSSTAPPGALDVRSES